MTESEAPMTARFGSGQAVRRLEDDALLQGQGRCVDGRALFVRSPHAHARIERIDLVAARAMPGVRGVFSSADLAPRLQMPRTPSRLWALLHEDEDGGIAPA